MNLYFVVLNEMQTGIVPSQVIAPARVCAKTFPGLTVRIVFLEPARVAARGAARRRLRALRRLWPEGRVGLYPYVGRFGTHAPAWTLLSILRVSSSDRDRVLLHCRGPEATLQAAHAVRGRAPARVLFDARGATSHEAVLRLEIQGMADQRAIDRAFANGALLDRRAADAADAIVAVSDPLLRALAEQFGSIEKPTGVMPCCVDRTLYSPTARAEVRGALGVEDGELVLVHVSTEARWEAFDHVIALFRAVRALGRARLLFVTTLAPDVVTASLPSGDPLRRDVVVRALPPEDVASHLSAADIGLLLRRSHATHRLASPIKFSEYLGAGLVVAVSDGIGTTGDLVRERDLGVLVPADPSAADVERLARELVGHVEQGSVARDRALRACEEVFVWDRYMPVLSRLYGLD
jgi:glycosyltransferase involved in cell wall biosynthesis